MSPLPVSLKPIDNLASDDLRVVHDLFTTNLYARHLRSSPERRPPSLRHALHQEDVADLYARHLRSSLDVGLSGDLNACVAPQHVQKGAPPDRTARPYEELTLSVRSKQ